MWVQTWPGLANPTKSKIWLGLFRLGSASGAQIRPSTRLLHNHMCIRCIMHSIINFSIYEVFTFYIFCTLRKANKSQKMGTWPNPSQPISHQIALGVGIYKWGWVGFWFIWAGFRFGFIDIKLESDLVEQIPDRLIDLHPRMSMLWENVWMQLVDLESLISGYYLTLLQFPPELMVGKGYRIHPEISFVCAR